MIRMKEIAESAQTLGYKYYLMVGAILGSANSFFIVHSGELIWTFILGLTGAIGAGLGKYVIDKMTAPKKKKKE